MVNAPSLFLPSVISVYSIVKTLPSFAEGGERGARWHGERRGTADAGRAAGVSARAGGTVRPTSGSRRIRRALRQHARGSGLVRAGARGTPRGRGEHPLPAGGAGEGEAGGGRDAGRDGARDPR